MSRDEMTTRERFKAVVNFEPVDRLPMVEWAGWWGETIDRWRSEGLSDDIVGRYNICRHFGLDVWIQDWYSAKGPDAPDPARLEQVRRRILRGESIEAWRWNPRTGAFERMRAR